MLAKFRERNTQEETMDDLSLSGDALTDALDDLRRINRWLGGNHSTVQGLRNLLQQMETRPSEQALRIVDLGRGGGDGLRAMAEWGRKAGWNLQLEGIDANACTLDYARKASLGYPEISYRQYDILDPSCPFGDYDIVVCALFLHHFTEAQQVSLLTRAKAAGVQAIVINDLHRHPLAYYLFLLVAVVFRLSPMARNDGAISVLKAFRRRELRELMQKCDIQQFSLKWKWAFRFQLLCLTS